MALLGFLAGDAAAYLSVFVGRATAVAICILIILLCSRQIIRTSAAILFVIFLAIGHILGAQALSQSQILNFHIANPDEEHILYGTVEKISNKGDYYSIILQDVTLATCHNRRILLITNTFDGIVGDYVWVRGQLAQLQPAYNQGQFDSRAYYKSLGIDIKITGTVAVAEPANIIYQCLDDFRRNFLASIENLTSHTNTGLLKSILMGEKSELDAGVNILFQDNGIAHILAISGLHLSMIGMGLYKLLRKFYFHFLSSATIPGLIMVGYGIITGNSVATVRALIMFIIAVYAGVWGRKYDILTACSLAALFLLADNPCYITNSSFLLSFGAILGIIFLAQPINESYKLKNPVADKVKETLVVSSSINIMTMPVLGLFYYEISPYSILINLMVIPLMSLVMACGIIGGLAGMVVRETGVFIIGTACYILDFYQWLCHIFEKLPYNQIITGSPAAVNMVVYYVILVLLVISAKYLKPKLLILAFGCILSCKILFYRNYQGLRLDMLYVGQGECIVVTCDNRSVMIDCGSSSQENVGEAVVAPYLKYNGISRLDGVFISHFDEDHYNGLEQVISQGIKVNSLYCGGISTSMQGSTNLYAGMTLDWADTRLSVQSPSKNTSYSDENTASLVMTMDYNGYRIIFTGDVDAATEKAIVPLCNTATLLKIAHHGSKNSSCEEFLQKINPDYAIISCGKDNSYGHPHRDTISRLNDIECACFVTAEEGQITVLFGEKVTVVTNSGTKY